MAVLDGLENAGATPKQQERRLRETMDLLKTYPELGETLRIRMTSLGGHTLEVAQREGLDG